MTSTYHPEPFSFQWFLSYLVLMWRLLIGTGLDNDSWEGDLHGRDLFDLNVRVQLP